jgi:hypothetical protein
MQDAPDTPDERLQRRQVRRWKRRARILGPFLGVPVLLLTLSLSVDLIEYQPQDEPDRLSDRPIRMTQPATVRPIMQPSLSSPTQAGSPAPATAEDVDAAQESDSEWADLDVTLPATSLMRTPTPPYAMGRH